ncbi:hypothetical protein PILCRDRAFT_811043 [Piloderma croceum F 1598]|uniref:Uncharacterized protein n=1 Tax=Piloderma croceum (strain F 1598) TaxID=765440 RepID=A0A0C3GML9_PILCF|nr:hypothetical protein PILCRDRAFT_811043 [Piloderma croceum F 1598]
MVSRIFLGLFVLFDHALASPVSAPLPSTASVIYVVLAILIVLAILAIIKYFYMKGRRSKSINLFSNTSHAYYDDPFSVNSYCRSSTSFHGAAEISENKCAGKNTGFLVGFLGSPAWETKISPEVDSAAWKQRNDYSFAYQLHTQSRQRFSQPYQPQWKSPSTSSRRSSSVGDGRTRITMRLSKSSSLNLPKRPQKSHDPLPRRLSLPSRGTKRPTSSVSSIGDVSRNRSRSNSRSKRKRSLRGLKTSKNSASNGISPSLVEETEATVFPLPRSLIFSSPSPLFLSNPFPPRFRITPSRKPVSPLPSLPVSDPLSSAANTSSTNIPVPSNIEISRPFPLLPRVTYDFILKSDPRDSMKGRSRDSRLYQELLPVLKPLDVYTSAPENKQPTQSDAMSASYRALSSVACPTNCASGSCSLPPLQNSPLLSSAPVCVQKAVLPKPRPKLKSTNNAHARARRSSSLGPSPLRTMILPDASSGSDIGSPRLDKNDKENQPLAASNQSSRRNLTAGAFGVRSSECGELGELPVDQEFASQFDSECIRASMNAEKASKILLSISREQEGTKRISTRSKNTRESATSKSRSWEPSKEVDLGLLGLDRFIGDGSTDGGVGWKDDSEIDFVSFWQEARSLDEDEKRRASVGLAW